MGALFEVLAPSSERGTRVDLGLHRLRNPTTTGRVHLCLPTGTDERALVLREVEAPRDPALDATLTALGDALSRVHDPAFVRLVRIARALEGSTVGIVSEYVEGTTGRAPHDASARARTVRAVGLSLVDALGHLSSEHGLSHGAIKPSNLLLGAHRPSGEAIPVRVFDLGVGPVARAITERLANNAAAHSLDAALAPGESAARLGGSLLCTATTWGVPGYVPIGHFAAAAPPTLETDLFGALASLWELLVGSPVVSLMRPPDDLPWSARAARLTLSSDAAWGTFCDNRARRDLLHATLTGSLAGAHSGALGNWVSFFDTWLARGATSPGSLDVETLRAELSALPDPHATAGTLPIVTIDDLPEDPQLPSVISLEPGAEYRAEVVLDYFSGEGSDGDRARMLRFRHVSMLGEGAMGSVHRVEILRAGEAPLPAALKLAIDDSVHNRDALLREAHVLRAQRLDGMAQFLALIELPGRALALLMSYQPGLPLDALLDRRRLTPAEAMTLGRRLLGTLVALHADASTDASTEVVHGDIKPGNVMIPLDANEQPDFGAAVLIDFGVSRLRLRLAAAPATTTDATTNQVLGGTTGYMPRGHLTGGASPASDVFAVAVVLYESLTGHMPWVVERAEQFSPFGLAFATEKLMRDREPSSISIREVPPWSHNLGWNSFFRKTLGHGDPERIPPARGALSALIAVRRDVAFPLIVTIILLALGALGARWFGTSYCPQGQVRCAGVCTDLRETEAHCGACGRACAAGQVCRAGVCGTSCPEGQRECAGTCHELATDRAHCGRCGNACTGVQLCSAGVCGVSCTSGFSLCGSTCRDTRTDRAHCGRCGNTCGAGQVCTDGSCTTSCSRGLTSCGGVCRDLTTDRAHCGACNRACDAGRVCERGLCVTSCTSGLTDCLGSCRDLATDRAHCGTCTHACGAGENCTRGACRQECPPGLSLCDGRCRDTSSDAAHCGACGTRCSSGERCESSRCALSCPSSLATCGDTCRDLSSDRSHCGRCEQSCAAGQVCDNGRCALTCPSGFSGCGSACFDLTRDEDHCGSCEHRCDRGQVCEGGRCAMWCGTGLTACGERCRDLETDESNCGSCARACGRYEVCAAGTCRSNARPVVAPTLPTTLPSGFAVPPGGSAAPTAPTAIAPGATSAPVGTPPTGPYILP